MTDPEAQSINRVLGGSKSLEILEREFEGLRQGRDEIALSRKLQFVQGKQVRESLDPASLVAALEVAFEREFSTGSPNSLGEGAHWNLFPGLLKGYRKSGMRTVNDVLTVARGKAFRRDCARAAALQGIAISNLSHLTLALLVLKQRSAEQVRELATELKIPLFVLGIRAPQLRGRA